MMSSRSTPNLQQPMRELTTTNTTLYNYLNSQSGLNYSNSLSSSRDETESPPPAPPVRDSSSLKTVKYGPGHEKFPSWPVPAAAEAPAALRGPQTGGSHRSKSWTDQTNYPKEKVVTYTRPYMKRQHSQHSQQKLKTVMERCEKIPPETYESRFDKLGDRFYLPHVDHDGKTLGDLNYVVPSPPERDITTNKPQYQEINNFQQEKSPKSNKDNNYNRENQDSRNCYKSSSNSHSHSKPLLPPNSSVPINYHNHKESVVLSYKDSPMTLSYKDSSLNYEDTYDDSSSSITYNSDMKLKMNDFIEYARKYEDNMYSSDSYPHNLGGEEKQDVLMHLHQKQLSYAQSEGYHSYVSSSDSTSTPFLDRLRRDSEAVVTLRNSNSWDDTEQDASSSVSRREGRDSVVTTSSGSASSSETLKWHGSMSDVSVASSCTHLGNSSSTSSISKQLIAHSARVQTPQRHNSESVLFIGSEAQDIWKDKETRNNHNNKLKLFPINTYTVQDDQNQVVNSNRLQPSSLSVADRISELEKQQKFSYLDPNKKHKVPDPTLKAIQKKALLSFYERHNGNASKSSSWRSEPQLVQSQTALTIAPQPPPRINNHKPSRRASCASDYASNASKRSSLASTREVKSEHKLVPKHQHSNSCGSLSTDLLGPVIVGPSISLDDFVPEKPPERPPKNPNLKNVFPDLFPETRVPSPDLPPPSPPTVHGDEYFNNDEPLPPPPPDIESNSSVSSVQNWQQDFNERLKVENSGKQMPAPQVKKGFRASPEKLQRGSTRYSSVRHLPVSQSIDFPNQKLHMERLARYSQNSQNATKNGYNGHCAMPRGSESMLDSHRAEPLRITSSGSNKEVGFTNSSPNNSEFSVDIAPPLLPRHVRINQSMRGRIPDSQDRRASPPREHREHRANSFNMSQSKASNLQSRRERERIVPDSDTGSYKRTMSPNGHPPQPEVLQNSQRDSIWSNKDTIIKNNNTNIMRRASMNDKPTKPALLLNKSHKEEIRHKSQMVLPDVLPKNAKILGPRQLSLAPMDDLNNMNNKTPIKKSPVSPPKSPFTPLRTTALSNVPQRSPSLNSPVRSTVVRNSNNRNSPVRNSVRNSPVRNSSMRSSLPGSPEGCSTPKTTSFPPQFSSNRIQESEDKANPAIPSTNYISTTTNRISYTENEKNRMSYNENDATIKSVNLVINEARSCTSLPSTNCSSLSYSSQSSGCINCNSTCSCSSHQTTDNSNNASQNALKSCSCNNINLRCQNCCCMNCKNCTSNNQQQRPTSLILSPQSNHHKSSSNLHSPKNSPTNISPKNSPTNTSPIIYNHTLNSSVSSSSGVLTNSSSSVNNFIPINCVVEDKKRSSVGTNTPSMSPALLCNVDIKPNTPNSSPPHSPEMMREIYPKGVEGLQLIQRTEVVLRVNPYTMDASSQTEKEELPPTPLPTRKKLKEEIECEKLSQDFVNQLGTSDRLKDLLVPAPEHKKPTDYVTGLFKVEITSKQRPLNSPFSRSRTNTPSSSPPPNNSTLTKTDSTTATTPAKSTEISTVNTSTTLLLEPSSPLSATSTYFTTSESKAKFLTRFSQDMDHLTVVKDTKDLNQKKEELVNRLGKKLEVLREEELVVNEECRINEELGENVQAHVSRVARPQEAAKYRLHVEEVGKITSLLLGLSGRLARAENALSGMPEDHAERRILESKRDKLREQLEEAKKLKESIDRRSISVASILTQYLNSEEFADYDHFINMKAKLIMDAKEVAEKIKLGEEQLFALKNTLILSD